MKIKKVTLTTLTYSNSMAIMKRKIDAGERHRSELHNMLCGIKNDNALVVECYAEHRLNELCIKIETKFGDIDLGETLLKPELKKFFDKYAPDNTELKDE